MFDRSTPFGSSLAGTGFRLPPTSPWAIPIHNPNELNMDDPASAAAQSFQPSSTADLPKPPPFKRSTIWDREHISETLAGIGAGFLGSQNFGDGLGAAAQTIAGRSRQVREEGRPDITYGGPGDQFEITTDRRTGARSYREVPEFRAALDRAAAAKRIQEPKDIADLRGRAMYAIATQVPPEHRAAAYRRLMDHPEQFGVDTTGMPAEWDETYGAVAGQMGMNVSQTRAADRGDTTTGSLVNHRKVMEDQGEARLQQGAARVAQGAQRVAQAALRQRTAPPGARKGFSTPKTRAQFDALPSGTRIVAPDGSIRIKP